MANETFELYSLTSKLTLDTSQFDRAYGESQKKARSLSGDLKQLEQQQRTTASGFRTELGSALSSVSPQLAALGTAGVGGLAIAGLGGMLTAVTALATGIWQLTSRFSEAGSELQDMSQQVNFAAETLSGLQGIGKSAGIEVENLSAGLVSFQKNLAAGNDVFKILGVTSKDNEDALRQTFKAISNVGDATTQTALAAEAFGTRGGKLFLSLIKETNGNLDESMDRLRKWGVLMSGEMVTRADDFGDALGRIGLRLTGIGNQVGNETAPAFTAAFAAIEAALDSNEMHWQWWGEQLAKVILTVSTLVGGVATAVKNIDLKSPFAPLQSILDFYSGANKTADAVVSDYLKRTHPNVGGLDFQLPPGLRPGSGIHLGGDKQDKATREKEDPIIRLMERYQDQLRNLTPLTEEQRAQEELLGKEYEHSSELQKALVLTIAKTIDIRKKTIEASEKQTRQQQREADMLDAFTARQEEAFRQLAHGEKTAIDEFNDFRVALSKAHIALSDSQEQWLRFNAMLLYAGEHARVLRDMLRDIAETTPPIAPNGVPTPDGNVLSPEDLRKLGEPPPEDPMAKWRRLADDLANDITYTIDRAIQRGFEDGIGAGVKEFALGILEMIRSEALRELERAIAKALSGGGGQGGEGGGGGDWLSRLLSFGISAVSSLFGGGSGGGWGDFQLPPIGGKAGGGFMSPHEWSWVGEHGPELVNLPQGSYVNNSQRSAQMKSGPVQAFIDYDELARTLARVLGQQMQRV